LGLSNDADLAADSHPSSVYIPPISYIM